MDRIPFLIISAFFVTTPYIAHAGKNDKKLTFDKEQRAAIKKIQGIVTVPSKRTSTRTPLLKLDPNLLNKSDIRRYVKEYQEEGIEEKFYTDYHGKKGTTLLIDVVKRGGESNDITFLLELGEDVNATDREGNTALHYLVKGRWKEKKKLSATLIPLLLNAGANPHIANKNKETALSIIEERKGVASLTALMREWKAPDKGEKNETTQTEVE